MQNNKKQQKKKQQKSHCNYQRIHTRANLLPKVNFNYNIMENGD